jgi:hypothetical protein
MNAQPMLRPTTPSFVLLTLTLTLAAAAARGQSGADPMHSAQEFASIAPRIVNGTVTSQYPTTGVLLDSGNFNFASMICSGTLIGCSTFLTAGHCVAGDLNPASYSVFLQHAGFFNVASIALHPDFNFPVGDVAVLKLSTPVTGIAPTPINATSTPPGGTPATIVGFGRSGGGTGNTDYGIKRAGAVTTSACSGGISGTTSVCWRFADPLGEPGSNSNTCNGDSGGPLLIDFGAGDTVAGVTSGGTSSTCLPADNSFDANVFFYRAWIQTQGGSDLNNTSCGTLPQVEQPGTEVFAAAGDLTAASSQATHTFRVPAATAELRVAMNAIDDGSDFDLYVKQGSPPTTSSFDCKADASNQYGYCEFDAPTPGPWYVLINRFAGSGAYQLTAATFGPDCSAPGSEGQSCDDKDACTTSDTCQAGICTGTAVGDGTPCDDGDACTQLDRCEAGVCAGSTEPRTGCQQPFIPERGLLRLQKTPGREEKLTWTWTRGTLTTKASYGDPLIGTSYDLCVYDQSAGTDHVILRKHIPAGGTCGTRPCWRESTQNFRYRDSRLNNGPVSSILLHQGLTDGKARIVIRAKGDELGLPTLPLDQQTTVTVQLSNGTACWEAQYSTNSKNTATDFAAKPD